MLADKLLAKPDYDCDREIRTLELLKLRFGEGNLHNCEVGLVITGVLMAGFHFLNLAIESESSKRPLSHCLVFLDVCNMICSLYDMRLLYLNHRLYGLRTWCTYCLAFACLLVQTRTPRFPTLLMLRVVLLSTNSICNALTTGHVEGHFRYQVHALSYICYAHTTGHARNN